MSLLRAALRNKNAFLISPALLSSSRLVISPMQRNFHSSRPALTAHENLLTARACKAWGTLQKASKHELFVYTNKGLAVLAPIAVVLSPSFLNTPVDLALGVIVPVHMYLGCITVIEDYIPDAQQGFSIFILGVLSALTGFGLLKINLCGVGVTESVKSLWRQPKAIE